MLINIHTYLSRETALGKKMSWLGLELHFILAKRQTGRVLNFGKHGKKAWVIDVTPRHGRIELSGHKKRAARNSSQETNLHICSTCVAIFLWIDFFVPRPRLKKSREANQLREPIFNLLISKWQSRDGDLISLHFGNRLRDQKEHSNMNKKDGKH